MVAVIVHFTLTAIKLRDCCIVEDTNNVWTCKACLLKLTGDVTDFSSYYLSLNNHCSELISQSQENKSHLNHRPEVQLWDQQLCGKVVTV
ncbi:hypothetical protein chiPu_0010906 [Chiloscyllium punctatum]|uniref:Uncharacterized protein n=1 Tax=Chiloscyllium punctatum TaxID=137246 RepID=A0A401SPW4_CHIPU|nr:hypothetical protein [Chiloscyllium punctatum]